MTYPTGYLNPVSLVGTPSTDTTTIQNAINAQNGPVVLPTGLWKINPLTMKPGTTLIGAGCGGYGPTADPDANQTHLNLNPGAATHMITVPTSTPDVTLRDIYLDGGLQSNNPNCDVIHVDDAASADQTNLRLERVHIEAAGNYGIYIGTKRDDVKAHHCMVLYSYKHGLLTKGPDGVYDACEFGSNGKDGASNNIELQAVVNRVTNCDIWSGTGTAQIGIVVLTGITGCVISGNGIDRHDKQGVYLNTGCYSIVVKDNVFHSNSQAADNTYAHCYAAADVAGAISFDGNVGITDGGITNVASYLLQAGTWANALWGSTNYALTGTGGSVHNLHN